MRDLAVRSLGRSDLAILDTSDAPILDTGKAAKVREWLLARGVGVGPVVTDRQGTHYIEMRDLENNMIEICEEP